jgi:diketogulonate reductase-like aldo/keto reductase
MSSKTIQKLNTGAAIPALGFGTWQNKEEQEEAVLEALKAGVSLFSSVSHQARANSNISTIVPPY